MHRKWPQHCYFPCWSNSVVPQLFWPIRLNQFVTNWEKSRKKALLVCYVIKPVTKTRLKLNWGWDEKATYCSGLIEFTKESMGDRTHLKKHTLTCPEMKLLNLVACLQHDLSLRIASESSGNWLRSMRACSIKVCRRMKPPCGKNTNNTAWIMDSCILQICVSRVKCKMQCTAEIYIAQRILVTYNLLLKKKSRLLEKKLPCWNFVKCIYFSYTTYY